MAKRYSVGTLGIICRVNKITIKAAGRDSSLVSNHVGALVAELAFLGVGLASAELNTKDDLQTKF